MFTDIIQTIEASDSIVIGGHFAPDGDCYGSQIGLKEAILANFPHKHVYVVGSGLTQFFLCLDQWMKLVTKSLLIL